MDLGVGQGRLSTVSIVSGNSRIGNRNCGSRFGDSGIRGLREFTNSLVEVNKGGNRTVDASSFHEPAMLEEVLKALEPGRGGMYLDGTVGGGGHAEAILTADEEIRLLAIDRDGEALERTSERLKRFGDRVKLLRGNYADVENLFDLGEGALAGVLLDLGVSSRQIDFLERGFSFRPGAPLDMRMSGEGTSAADLLATLSIEEMTELFRDYGEIKRARRLASEIATRRERAPLSTSDDLLNVMEELRGRAVPASQAAPVFQALRIAVNGELDSLQRALPVLRDLLAPGGRMVVISYHSLEDRLVKRAFRDWSRECVCPPGFPECRCRGRALGWEVERRPLRPATEETDRNPRARSARLRVWERGE